MVFVANLCHRAEGGRGPQGSSCGRVFPGGDPASGVRVSDRRKSWGRPERSGRNAPAAGWEQMDGMTQLLSCLRLESRSKDCEQLPASEPIDRLTLFEQCVGQLDERGGHHARSAQPLSRRMARNLDSGGGPGQPETESSSSRNTQYSVGVCGVGLLGRTDAGVSVDTAICGNRQCSRYWKQVLHPRGNMYPAKH